MDIIISNTSPEPIYGQIVSQIKGAILSGAVAEGSPLPSIRALANELRVSVITTKRAYAELEEAGFIETVPGKGSFVSGGNSELLREEQLRTVETLLSQALEAARQAGLERSEVQELFTILLDENSL